MATSNPPHPATLRALAFAGAFLLCWTGTVLRQTSSHAVTAPVPSAAAVAMPRAVRPSVNGDTSDDSRAGHGRSARNARWALGSRQAPRSPMFGGDGSGGRQTGAGDARAYLLQTSASLRSMDLPRANRAEVVGLGP